MDGEGFHIEKTTSSNGSTIHSVDFTFDLVREDWANYVKNSLDVDKELKPKLVTRVLGVEGARLKIHYSSVDLKALRTSVSSFFDMADIVVQTINQFHSTQA
ncbi:hypothetical protein PROFUN_06266 [Planoprotostelium fungivorum]|uniref:Transcription factor Pcc1 n=1 Tax=Planoprotostelium fungivorum TaxID=1890364 RepID=A0A2P6NE66_9EUKA|nr:hypothetical protein PROFUN_06266 [Planoprotostelium fungivorum]